MEKFAVKNLQLNGEVIATNSLYTVNELKLQAVCGKVVLV